MVGRKFYGKLPISSETVKDMAKVTH